MRNDIYLHSSNIDNVIHLKEDELFEPIHFYEREEFEKSNRNEYGRIKTHKNYFHILLGTIPNENCPWCNHKPIFQRYESTIEFQPVRYFMRCLNCGSCGPVLNVMPSQEFEKEFCDKMVEHTKQRYKYRKMCDG